MAKVQASVDSEAKVTATPDTAIPKSGAKKAKPRRPSTVKHSTKKPVKKRIVAKKQVARKAAASKNGKTAAPKAALNKAQAIREEAAKIGKKVRPKDVIAALKARGITVSSAQVSITLKAAGYRRSRRGSKGAAEAANKGPQTTSFAVSQLVVAKKLADQLGGIARLKEIVAALERLQ